MTPHEPLFRSNRYYKGPVHLQQVERRTASGRDTVDTIASPLKVIPPDLATGMKQGYVPFGERITGTAAGTFAQRAGHTRKGEILCSRFPAFGDRMDVIYMECRLLPGL